LINASFGRLEYLVIQWPKIVATDHGRQKTYSKGSKKKRLPASFNGKAHPNKSDEKQNYRELVEWYFSTMQVLY
jgi:hypothetical protein